MRAEKTEKNRKVLIIDDDMGIRDSYEAILQPEQESCSISTGRSLFESPSGQAGPAVREGYELSLAENGTVGIEKVRAARAENRPFAVAFSDMKMPGLNGAETSRRIWEIDPDIKIVIVTAYNEYSVDELITIVGREDLLFLRKPFHEEEILQFAATMTHIWVLERKNRHHRRILHQTVMERTSQLVEANRRLQKSDNEKSAFMGYLSHSINTPLNWIGVTEMMDKDELNEDNKALIGFVEDGFERLSEFMSEMISYFDISNPGLKMELEQLSLKKIMTTILELETGNITRKKLDVQISIPDDITVFADFKLFHKLVHVLVNNAIMFSGAGGRVAIEVHEEEGALRLDIRDWGCGIAPDKIPGIFDPYTNLGDLRRKTPGFGLSLTKAKTIADLHAWDLTAWSHGAEK